MGWTDEGDVEARENPQGWRLQTAQCFHVNTNKVVSVKLKNHDLDREWQG
jgi:hypothetical protein